MLKSLEVGTTLIAPTISGMREAEIWGFPYRKPAWLLYIAPPCSCDAVTRFCIANVQAIFPDVHTAVFAGPGPELDLNRLMCSVGRWELKKAPNS